MAETSIQNLRVYTLACESETKVAKLLSTLNEDSFYDLANDLRRSSCAVAHYINDAHRRYSYTIKLDCLHAAVAESEQTKNLLTQYEKGGHGKTEKLKDDYTAIIKQCWGLIKWIRTRQADQQAKTQTQAKDELVEARS